MHVTNFFSCCMQYFNLLIYLELVNKFVVGGVGWGVVWLVVYIHLGVQLFSLSRAISLDPIIILSMSIFVLKIVPTDEISVTSSPPHGVLQRGGLYQ